MLSSWGTFCSQAILIPALAQLHIPRKIVSLLEARLHRLPPPVLLCAVIPPVYRGELWLFGWHLGLPLKRDGSYLDRRRTGLYFVASVNSARRTLIFSPNLDHNPRTLLY